MNKNTIHEAIKTLPEGEAKYALRGRLQALTHEDTEALEVLYKDTREQMKSAKVIQTK